VYGLANESVAQLLRIRQKLYGPWPYAPGVQTFTYLQQAPRPTFAGLDSEGSVMIFWVETDGETGYVSRVSSCAAFGLSCRFFVSYIVS